MDSFPASLSIKTSVSLELKMSRTLNTMPYLIQKNKRELWRSTSSYPSAMGGAWPNRSKYARTRNRQFRLKCKRAIQVGHEMPVAVREVAWDVW